MWMHANHGVLELKDDSGENEAAEDCSTSLRGGAQAVDLVQSFRVPLSGCFGKYSGEISKQNTRSLHR